MNALEFPPPAPGEAREVAEGILWIRMPMPWRLDHVNVYALDDGDGWTVVDTGLGTRGTRALWEAILAGPLSGRPVRRVVATHHHPDHIGLVGWFADQGAEVLATRTAWLSARMLVLDVQDRPHPRQVAFWRAAGMAEEMCAKRATERPFNMADVCHPLPPGFRRLVDGGRVTMGGRDWAIRFGQGHAPDHATFWTDGLVLAGDQCLARISPNISVHATEPEADPLGEWLEACDRLAAGAGEELVLPGHEAPFRGPAARLRQMAANHRSALDRMVAGLTRPRAAAACFPLLFRRPIAAEEYTLALGETLAHLNRLRAEARVVREETAEGIWLWQRAGDWPDDRGA